MKIAARVKSMRALFISMAMCSLIWSSACVVYAFAQGSPKQAQTNDPEFARLRDKVEKLQADQMAFALDIKPQLTVLETKINAILAAIGGLLSVGLALGVKAIYEVLIVWRTRNGTDVTRRRRGE